MINMLIMEQKNYKVSVVITAYNLENYIGKAIESVLNQTYKNLEIIIVNDASTDNTLEVIKKYDDPRIIIINNEINVGSGKSRKSGIEKCTGEFVEIIDGDDWISLDYIEKLVNRQIETNADIVGGGVITIDEETGESNGRSFGNISVSGLEKWKIHLGKIIYLNNMIVRRTLYNSVPYSDYRYCEDTPVINKLFYFANKVSYISEIGYHYLQRKGSLSHSVNRTLHYLFCTRCAIDLMKFFSTKEDMYKNLYNENIIIEYMYKFKALNPTYKDIEDYKDVYIDCSLEFIKSLKFKQQ